MVGWLYRAPIDGEEADKKAIGVKKRGWTRGYDLPFILRPMALEITD